jgi:hypothetical protein
LQIGIVFRQALSEIPQRCRAAQDAASRKIADPTQSSLYSIQDYLNHRDGWAGVNFGGTCTSISRARREFHRRPAAVHSPRMLRRIPERGTIQRPFHIDPAGILRRQHDLRVSDIRSIGVVINGARPFIADTLAGASAAALVALLPLPRPNVLTCRKQFATAS